jgi:hypothetical protein
MGTWPIRIPQQILRFTPTRLDEPVQLVQATGARATYDPRSDMVVLKTQISNKKLVGFTTANLTDCRPSRRRWSLDKPCCSR